MPLFRRKNGISIYYEVKGLKDATETCVLIGGLTRDHTIWRSMIPLLEKNFCVIVFDNRDSGQSSIVAEEYGIAELAEDVADLIGTLGFYQAHIIGHSMGGFMGVHIAAKHPELVKTLVLCNTAEKQVPAGIQYLNNRIKLIDQQPANQATTASREDIIAVMDKIYAPEMLKDTQFIEAIIRHETHNPFPQSSSSFKRQAKACINHNAEDLLKYINCPTLVITGEHDKTYTPEIAKKLASKLPHAKVVIIPKAAHMIQLEQARLLYVALNDFIMEHRCENVSGLSIWRKL